MANTFKDHFSDSSWEYNQFRPSYPDELYYHLASVTPEHNCAWDCATGTGQAAIHLTKYYKKVIASDASENQLNQAQQHKRIYYITAAAEHSGIDDQSIDLITVAQALHWFDIDAFATEADRVLVKRGVLAAWTYNLLTINPELDAIIEHLYHNLVGPYWPAERKLVETGYQGIELPFEELAVPHFEMCSHWNLQQLVGYLMTWSACKRYEADQKQNPLELIYDDLLSAWGNQEQEYQIAWPLSLRIWCKN